MRYSYTKLTSFDECRYAFYRYYQKNEQGENNVFALYGIIMHSILERYAKGELQITELAETFEEEFNLAISQIMMFGKDLTYSYYSKGMEFLENFNGFWGLKPLEAEYHFETPLGEDTFVGVIDLIALDENDNIIIVDHKSSSKFSKKELKDKVKQLYLYSKAIFDKYGKFPKELWFNHFKNQHQEKIPFDIDVYNETIKWALAKIQEIEACMEFNPNTSDKFHCCYLCDYRNNCEYKE